MIKNQDYCMVKKLLKYQIIEMLLIYNASRASKPASPLSSPTDYPRRSITAALTTDFDGFSSGAGRGRAGRRGAGFDNTIVCTLQTATRLR